MFNQARETGHTSIRIQTLLPTALHEVQKEIGAKQEQWKIEVVPPS